MCRRLLREGVSSRPDGTQGGEWLRSPHPRESLERCALRAQLRGDPHARHRLPGRPAAARRAARPVGPRRAARLALRPGTAAALERRAGAGRGAAAGHPPARPQHPAARVRRWAARRLPRRPRALRWGQFASRRRAARPASRRPARHARRRSRCTWSARTASTTRAARCGAVRWPPRCTRSGRAGSSSAAISAATGSPPTCWCCRPGCSTGGCCRSPRRSSSPRPRPARWSARCCAAGSGCRRPPRPRSPSRYEHLALRAAPALRVASTTAVVDGVAVVRLRGPHGRLEVTVRVETVAADGLTCANPRPNRYLRYRPVSIIALEPSSARRLDQPARRRLQPAQW